MHSSQIVLMECETGILGLLQIEQNTVRNRVSLGPLGRSITFGVFIRQNLHGPSIGIFGIFVNE